MKKYLTLIFAVSLSLIQTLAWAEQVSGEPQYSQTELNKEQSERHMAPLDKDREIKVIMINQELNEKGNRVDMLTNEIKKSHNTDESIIRNLK